MTLLSGPLGAVHREIASVLPDRTLLLRARLHELGASPTRDLVVDLAMVGPGEELELVVLVDPDEERHRAVREALPATPVLALASGEGEDELLAELHRGLADVASPVRAADPDELHAAELQGWGQDMPRTGLSELDRRLGPLEPGDLVIVGGVTGVGKSSFLRHLAIENAVGRKMPVIFVSLEASASKAATEIVASCANVSSQRLGSGNLTAEEERRVKGMARKLHDSPLTIVGRADVTTRHLEGLLRAASGQARMLLVDYLELLSHESRGEALRHIKRLARRHDLPAVVATNDLHVASIKRVDGRPTLLDLGEMGLHADKVLLLHREEVYDLRRDSAYIMETTIAKNRGGPKTMVQIAYREESQSYHDLEVTYDEELQGS